MLFVELTNDDYDRKKVCLNPEKIVAVGVNKHGQTIVDVVSGTQFTVEESYDEVVEIWMRIMNGEKFF